MDDDQDLEMTDQEFDDRMARGEDVVVVAAVQGGVVAGGDVAANKYLVTNTEPRIALADPSATRARLPA